MEVAERPKTERTQAHLRQEVIVNQRDIYVMIDVYAERDRQRLLGHLDSHDYADGTGQHLDRALPLPSAASVRARAEAASAVPWSLVLLEEVLEALEEDDEARLREELIQVAAVAVRWAGAIDERMLEETDYDERTKRSWRP